MLVKVLCANSDGATIDTDASAGNVFKVQIQGNRALANPTNMISGFTYTWIVQQDNVGSRTLSYGDTFLFPGGVSPTLTTTISGIDILSAVYDGVNLYCSAQKDFS